MIRFLFAPVTKSLVIIGLLVATGVGLMKHVSSNRGAYSEKRLGNFVLSEETPISIGHGVTGLSASTELVDILVEREAHFRVPRNYIQSIIANAHARSVMLVLVTLFPDFAGATVDGARGTLPENLTRLWWDNYPNLIRILSTTKPFSVEHDGNTIVFTAEEHEPDSPWKYGLLKSKKRSHALTDVYFVRPGAEYSGYVVYCSTEGIGPCNIDLRLSERLVIQYQFHKSLLPHWQEIHQKVSALIESFIVKGEK
jgi:hypothetical protein